MTIQHIRFYPLLFSSLRRAMPLILVFLLYGCAADMAFREGKELVAAGQYAQGFSKVEEALKLDPRNTEYKLYLSSRRGSTIVSQLTRADTLREQGRLVDAEKGYQAVLELEASNAQAKAGLEKVALERRHRQLDQEAEAAFKAGDMRRTEELVRRILTENPQQKEARNLEGRMLELQARAQAPEIKLAENFRKPVSLEFRDAPVRAVFEVLSKASNINFVYDRDIRPDLKTTIFVKNTPMDEAIRLISVTSQLETRILNENSILVYPSNPQKLKDYQQLSVRSFYLANADAKQVSNTLKTILKTKDLVVNEKLNLVIMRDTPDAIRLAEKLVALEDVNEPEVMLEVEILEVKRTNLLDLGIQWPNQLTLSPLAPGVTALTLSDLKHLNSDTIGATLGNTVIKAQKEDSDVNILANPRIRVKNREKAKIMIGDRVPVITSTSTSTGFVAESVNYVDVGLKLEVEPNIYLDDEASIKVGLEVSNLVREITTKSGTLSYQIGTRNANTVLRLKDGETQVLAGLINDEDRRTANRVPGLGELPILNRLFGSQKDDRQKTEIVLSITPHLVRNIRRPDAGNSEFDTGTETNLGARPLVISAPVDASSSATLPGAAGKPVATMTPQVQSALAVPVVPVDVTAKPAEGNLAQKNASPVAAVGSGTGAGMSLAWQAPSKVRAGEQFSVALRLTSQPSVSSLPVLIAWDTETLQLVDVKEGDFLKQGGGNTNFSSRSDPVSGKVFLAGVRQGGTVNGSGTLALATFKAVKPTAQSKIQLLSASPEPLPAGSSPPGAPDLTIAIE